MGDQRAGGERRLGLMARAAIGRIEVLAVFPALVLIADWAGFDDLALVTALSLSALLSLAVLLPHRTGTSDSGASPESGKAGLLDLMDHVAEVDGKDTVCLLVQVMDWGQVVDTWGHDAAQEVSARLQDRLRTALRGGDRLARLGDARFGIVLGPMSAARLGIRDSLALRLATVAQEPLPLNGSVLRLSVSIGHSALRRRAANQAEATFKSAEAALAEASASGKGEIRAYADGMGRARSVVSTLSAEVEEAIHSAEIDTWFQPQICAETGALACLEALARWQHPVHGLLGESEILPAIDASGQRALFGETMMHRAAEALAEFDATDAHVPAISVNLSEVELQHPDLPERIRFELLRYDLTADRIALEFSGDTVARQDSGPMVRNLAALQEDGHSLVLDRAGPTAVPFPALQRFSVDAIKIDRALVLGIDTDPQRVQAVSAIVAMAKAMGMDTIATGVETRDEMTALARLGCARWQGYGVARPMRRDQVADWVRRHRASGYPILLGEKRAG